ncbi:unnamed protein product, partial [marine sediment metagenome]
MSDLITLFSIKKEIGDHFKKIVATYFFKVLSETISPGYPFYTLPE